MGSLINLKPRQSSGFTGRLNVFLYFCYIILFLILLRVFYLQIIKSDYYVFLAEGNTEQRYPLIPPRGLIYDRNGVIVAKNKAAYHLSIIPAYLPKKKEALNQKLNLISKQFDIPLTLLQSKVQPNLRSYRSFLIRENLPKKKILYLEENKQNFPFLDIIEYSSRIYPFGESTSHLLGYIGIINQSELARFREKGYRRDSIIGKTGIEKEYDGILRGVDGENVKVVNSLGKPIRNLHEKSLPPIPGKNVLLSIDANLQDLAYNALYGRRGAVVVSKPSTGEILALVSSKGFDPNQFMNPDTRNELFTKLAEDPENPMLNRVIQGKYPPGSVFKIITAIAGMEDNKINPTDTIHCRGFFDLGDRTFKDLKRHGPAINLYKALEESCNIYFYTLGYNLGYASILEYSTNLGLGALTHIDIPGEIPGFIPTPEWKENRFKETWYDGDTVNASIGQGFIMLTPIGANNLISSIAAGRVFRPRVLWKIKNPYTGMIEKEYKPHPVNNFKLQQRTLDAIREGLRRVPLTGTGTYHKYLSQVQIAGKTGSAQNVKSKTHSWFVSYGPLDKTLEEQYTVVVMVETAGHGGSVAVPIASVLYNFMEGKMDRERALKAIYEVFSYQEGRGESLQD